MVDSVFVAQLSEDALNAVSLAFPVQNLMIAVAVGTGVGINALLSRSLGQKDFERANQTAMNGLSWLQPVVWCLPYWVGPAPGCFIPYRLTSPALWSMARTI